MKKALVLILLSFSMSFLTSCYYDNEEELYGTNQVCDTVGVAYSTVVQPILQSRCLGCHSGANASAGIDLASYDNVNVFVQTGRLIGVIDHQPGFSAMPKGTPKMPSCEIDKIKSWVNSGAPNN